MEDSEDENPQIIVGPIVFSSERATPNRLHLFSMNADGTNVTPVTLNVNCPEFDSGVVSPRWSPDKTRIIFVDLGLYRRLLVMDRDGSNCRVVFDENRDVQEAAWSPDGDRIAFCWKKGTNSGVSIVNPDGSQEQVVLQRGVVDGLLACDLDWSPDGRFLVFTVDPLFGTFDIRLWDLQENSLKRIKAIDDLVDQFGIGLPRNAAWSPGGTRIAFSVSLVNRFSNAVSIFDFRDGSVSVYDLGNRLDFIDHIRWSPDGSMLVFDGKEGAFHDVWIVNSDGTGLRNLTNSTDDEGTPDWG